MKTILALALVAGLAACGPDNDNTTTTNTTTATQTADNGATVNQTRQETTNRK